MPLGWVWHAHLRSWLSERVVLIVEWGSAVPLAAAAAAHDGFSAIRSRRRSEADPEGTGRPPQIRDGTDDQPGRDANHGTNPPAIEQQLSEQEP
jgi:hypothetical protein